MLTLSPNRTAGEDKIAVYFHQTLYPPLDQEAYKRKKPPPKPLKWKLWNLLSFHKKKHRRRCAPITGEAEILGHFGPRQGASERDTKATGRLSTTNWERTPLSTPNTTCCLDDFPFPGNSYGPLTSSHLSEARFDFRRKFFQEKNMPFYFQWRYR